MIERVIKTQDFDNASSRKIKRSDYPDTAKKNVENRGKDNKEHVTNYENKRLKEAIDRIVDAANSFNHGIRIEVENDMMIVKIIDEKTGQVIRQVPSEELVKLSNNAKDLKGLLINREG